MYGTKKRGCSTKKKLQASSQHVRGVGSRTLKGDLSMYPVCKEETLARTAMKGKECEVCVAGKPLIRVFLEVVGLYVAPFERKDAALCHETELI